jgi:predicted RNase H-like nuclease
MTPAEEVFDRIAPPIRLLDYLEKLFKFKTDKGEEIPFVFTEWMQTWAEIRGNGSAVTDTLTAEDWIEFRKLVKVAA